MEHSVRIATLSDIPAMMAVINAVFAIETFLEGTRTDEARLSEMMGKGSFLLACDASGGVLASVYVELRDKRGYFGMLAVSPAEQGKGLGRVMVEAAEDYCHQHGCALLDIAVLSLRPELPAFYTRLGFVQPGTEEFRPSRPLKAGVECHWIVMSKTL